MLGYLAMRGPDPVPRIELASLLWADVPPRQALHSLRQSLWELRGALAPHGDGVLTSNRETVRLAVNRMRVDARTFEWLLERGTPTSVRRACMLYKGDFLAGLRLPEPAFERWLNSERARLKALAWAAYRQRLNELQSLGRSDEAMVVAVRMIRIDRFAEKPRAALLAALTERGDFRKACRHYEGFARLLRRRLGTRPSASLQQTFLASAARCGWKSRLNPETPS